MLLPGGYLGQPLHVPFWFHLCSLIYFVVCVLHLLRGRAEADMFSTIYVFLAPSAE